MLIGEIGEITGLDFNADGEKIATIDLDGGLIVSDVNTSSNLSFFDLTERPSSCKIIMVDVFLKCFVVAEVFFNRCRWNPQVSHIATSFNNNMLGFLDSEKGEMISTYTMIEKTGCINFFQSFFIYSNDFRHHMDRLEKRWLLACLLLFGFQSRNL